MQSRDGTPPPPRFGDIVLRTGPNWTGVSFMALLGGLHLSIGIPSLVMGRWAGYLSLIFGALLLAVAAGIYLFRTEMRFHSATRRLFVRTGVGRLCCVRCIPFARIRGVRLTVSLSGRPRHSTIELLSDGEDLPCPTTKIPRQQALFLALLLAVPLIKVSPDEGEDPRGESRTAEPFPQSRSV